jgi:hypothetical protein
VTTKSIPESLRVFARDHRVSAEISPHYEIGKRQRTETGLDLTLLARPSARCAGNPGCEDCQRVHAQLRELARLVLPEGWCDAAEPFDAAFHYRRETEWQPEIEIVVEMQPRTRARSADATARRELPEIRKRLRDVGVGQKMPARVGQPA